MNCVGVSSESDILLNRFPVTGIIDITREIVTTINSEVSGFSILMEWRYYKCNPTGKYDKDWNSHTNRL